MLPVSRRMIGSCVTRCYTRVENAVCSSMLGRTLLLHHSIIAESFRTLSNVLYVGFHACRSHALSAKCMGSSEHCAAACSCGQLILLSDHVLRCQVNTLLRRERTDAVSCKAVVVTAARAHHALRGSRPRAIFAAGMVLSSHVQV